VLKGEKVILRAITRDDLERLCQFENDVELSVLANGAPWRPDLLARVQAEFDDQLHHEPPQNRVRFAIEADDKCIGDCSLQRIDRTSGTTELGISIGDRDYLGRGYGRDAIRVLLRYAFRIQNLYRVWLGTGSDNERAIRCYRACGFVEEGRLRQHAWSEGKRVDMVCMGLLRDEWEAGEPPMPSP
jgi:RimJ/RimL family protein N-acetyltransferase